jgi:hypothetical protein
LTPTTFLTVNINWLLQVWCKVQAWVAHNVTPLKCTYIKSDWQVSSQKPHKKHIWPNKYLHHGDWAANLSGGVDQGEGRLSHIFSEAPVNWF